MRVQLAVNNNSGVARNVTVRITGLAPIVVQVPLRAEEFVLRDIPVQQTDPAAGTPVQINVQGDDGAGNAVFVVFGSFVVT